MKAMVESTPAVEGRDASGHMRPPAPAALTPRWGLVRLIRVYRAAVSPVLPRSCRFEPSCSAYAEEALHRLSLPRALLLILRRVSRCHPFHPGGYDPVP